MLPGAGMPAGRMSKASQRLPRSSGGLFWVASLRQSCTPWLYEYGSCRLFRTLLAFWLDLSVCSSS